MAFYEVDEVQTQERAVDVNPTLTAEEEMTDLEAVVVAVEEASKKMN